MDCDPEHAPKMQKLLGQIEELKERISESLDPSERPALESKRCVSHPHKDSDLLVTIRTSVADTVHYCFVWLL